MATKLNTRILLRYDSYLNWNTNNPVLLTGEVAIVVPGDKLADVNTGVNENGASTPCLMKVGDGIHSFNQLPWLSAVAADVHSWAKLSKDDFKRWMEGDLIIDGLARPDLATKTEVNKVASDLAALAGRVTTAEGDIDALEVRMGTAEGDIDALEGRMNTAETDITNLKNAVGTGENGLVTKVEGLTTRMDTAESNISANATAITNITKDNGAIATAVAAEKSRAEGIEAGLRTDVDAIKGDYLKGADKTELEGKITAEEAARSSAISGLKTELTTEINKKANAADVYTKTEADAAFMTETEVKACVDQVIADAVDTDTLEGLVDLVEYAHENAGDLAALTQTVNGHTASLSTVAGQITALQTKDTNLDADIKAINDKIGNDALAEGETIISTITANDTKAQGYATTAQNNAKAYTDAEIAKVNTTAEGLSSTVAGHTTLLAGIEGTTVKADINAAQAAAEQKVTDLANGQVKTNKEAIEAINNGETGILAQAKSYTDDEIDKVESALAGEKAAREAFDAKTLTGAISDEKLTVSLNGTALEIIFDCGGATAHFTA